MARTWASPWVSPRVVPWAGPRTILLLAALTAGACGNSSNPFDEDTGDDSSDEVTADSAISRSEAVDGNGGGYVSGVSYDAGTDTFTVKGLAFDGDGTYSRLAAPFSSLGGYALYEGAMTYYDDETGAPISQMNHRAIYGVSGSGKTEFAIVRSGGYLGYGFGGFIYQRNGAVTLPSSGQATYTGQYAGLRVFDGTDGIEYSQGDMTVSIDFTDFEDGSAVSGSVSNRQVFDADGNDVTAEIADALVSGATELPVLTFVVEPGVMDDAGELTGSVSSHYSDGGSVTDFETGSYYAILSDGAGGSSDPADEIVGIIVMTSEDPRNDALTVQETGGFILYR